MTRPIRASVLTLVLAAAALISAPSSNVEAAPPDGVKTVTLICERGVRASAQGLYGGVGFSVDCNNGRGHDRLTGVSGTTYSTRIGAETSSTGIDCFFTGDAETVSVSCGGAVTLNIN